MANSPQRASALRSVVMPVLLGLVMSASVCWPLYSGGLIGQGVWWLQIGCLALLARTIASAPGPRAAFLRAQCFATAWLSSTFWWLYISMHTYGGLPAPMAVFAVLALAFLLALYYGAALALCQQILPANAWAGALVFACLWTLAEMARGTWLTGFGWGAIGYAHEQGPLAPTLPLLGMYGAGLLAAFVAACLGTPKLRWQYKAAVAVVLLALAHVPTQTTQWTRPAGQINVALLQGNVAQDQKFESSAGIPQALKWYGQALLQAQDELVVAPETAIPLLPQQLPQGYLEQVQARFAQGDSAAMVGIPLGNYDKGYTNSVIALVPGRNEEWVYHKHHLVPFGEFIPPLFRWFTRMMNIPLGDFERGALGQPPLNWKSQRLGANICYEDLFGEELGARFADDAAAPTIFVNLSNIAWFGDSIAIDQHLQISRVRALEFQRPFVRATNTGATAVVDHHGQVQASLPRLTRGILRGTVQGRDGLTPYAWWVSRWGLWPLWILCCAVVGAVVLLGARRTSVAVARP